MDSPTVEAGMNLEFLRPLVKRAETRIVLLVVDGLGGLPEAEGGPTELERARTPNLDDLARRGICGLHEPVGAGITPGSGPSHLALFGYDPIRYQLGRGVLEALGIDFDLGPDDVAARGNFCTVDASGKITDRRAGRIGTDKNRDLCGLLRKVAVPGVQVFVEPVKEHRFVLVLRGRGLSGDISDTDPQSVGKTPLDPVAHTREAEPTAKMVAEFVSRARDILAGHHPANMIVLRGFSKRPAWPTFGDIFGLKAAAIAAYPMYRGLAKLLGMKTLATGEEIADEFATLERHWDEYDFFYVHVKKSDSAGEDGDFERKVRVIEEVDAQIPRLMRLRPDVIVVTGDHSTPAALKMHSWNPVPVLLWSRYCRPDSVERFSERDCLAGGLGPRFPATDIMPLALANALRLEKFGA